MENLLVKLTFLLLLSSHGCFAADCEGVEVLDNAELSCKVKLEIVRIHNKYRQQVAKGLIKGQPQASNMQEMFWDDELARGAQAWANQCTFEHNSNDERKVERFLVGQNLATSKNLGGNGLNEGSDFEFAIKNWVDEHELYHFEPIGSISGVGHYTQVVWADTYLVGCGYIKYKDADNWRTRLYVCNYGPAGNIVGRKPYKVGNSAMCTGELKKSITYPGLCKMRKPHANICNSHNGEAQLRMFITTERPSARTSPDNDVIIENPSNTINTRRSLLGKIKKMEYNTVNSTDPMKTYNFITINIFH